MTTEHQNFSFSPHRSEAKVSRRLIHLLYSLLVPASRFTLVERALQIHLFMQNKANFQKAATSITPVLIKGYANIPLRRRFKNKANSNPIEPNRQNPKMNSNSYYTMAYEKKQRFYTAKNKANFRNEYNLLFNKGLRKFMYIITSKTNPNSIEGFTCRILIVILVFSKR